MNDRLVRETNDRVRRIETRLTKYLEAQGFDTQVQRPGWDNGTISIPSLGCSIEALLSVIPEGWDPEEDIEVTHKGYPVLSFYTPE